VTGYRRPRFSISVTTEPCRSRSSTDSTLWYRTSASLPKRRSISARTIAVISSGDQDGPHPPEKQSAALGTSKTSTMTGWAMLPPLSDTNCATGACPNAHAAARASVLQHRVPVCSGVKSTVDRDDSTLGTHASRGATRRAVATVVIDSNDCHGADCSSLLWAFRLGYCEKE